MYCNLSLSGYRELFMLSLSLCKEISPTSVEKLINRILLSYSISCHMISRGRGLGMLHVLPNNLHPFDPLSFEVQDHQKQKEPPHFYSDFICSLAPHTHPPIHIETDTDTHIYIHLHTYTHTHTRIQHKYTHTHTYTLLYTITHTLLRRK